MIDEIFADAEKKFQSTIEHFKSELAVMRSSQVSPALVEDITVSAYEDTYPLKELAAISSPEPNSLVIQPWDQSVVEEIEKALLQAELGTTPVLDGNVIRLNIPTLSEERRDELSKRVGEKAEEAKVAIRNIRQEKMKALDNLADNSKISEDDHERLKKDMQDLVDEHTALIEDLREKKTQRLQEM